jgi:6-phosphogluconolactonase
MEIHILADAEAVAAEAARVIAGEARAAVAARGRFVIAVSGGRTPWRMLRALAEEDVPWSGVHVVQVDERIAPAGDPDRNLTHMRESLLQRVPLPEDHVHAMPVEEDDVADAALRYARTLERIAGMPPVLDLAHLGLGTDGHTASLVPDDPVLDVTDRDVALTGIYMERRRMTLTYPMLNRSRRVLWLVTGADKRAMLSRLRAADRSIPDRRCSLTVSLNPTTGYGLSVFGFRPGKRDSPRNRSFFPSLGVTNRSSGENHREDVCAGSWLKADS